MVDEQDYVWWPLPDGLDAVLKSITFGSQCMKLQP